MINYIVRSIINICEYVESCLYNPTIMQVDLNMYAFFIGIL